MDHATTTSIQPAVAPEQLTFGFGPPKHNQNKPTGAALARNKKRSTDKKRSPSKKSTLPSAKQKAPSPPRRTSRSKETAETLAKQQREISISEFFAKNRHLLGFDNKRKALLTTVKEAVDNSLDACEEADILPEVSIVVRQIDEDRFQVITRDNGPGIVKEQIPNIFGKLLYGSKFHRLRMSRGQQGIGISAAGMYGLLTTGKPIRIISRTGSHKQAHHYKIQIDTKRNRPEVILDEKADVDWPHGTEVSIELVASYGKGRQSIDEYVEQTSIANPHASFLYESPTGERTTYPRSTEELPPQTREIKPHPYGIELGLLLKMLKETNSHKVGAFLQSEFSRVSPRIAKEVCKKSGITPLTYVKRITGHEAEKLYKALQETRTQSPRTDCLAPIGVQSILSGLLRGVKAEFYAAGSRPPTVYRGNPFQVEVGLAYGGDLSSDGHARVIRFANRVPLLYQQSHCTIFRSIVDTNWRAYSLSQSHSALPTAPLVIMVHFASVWVPFTSESKEAIADYDEIRKELKLVLQECGRKLAGYVRRRQRTKQEGERRSAFVRYIEEVVQASNSVTRINKESFRKQLLAIARERTAKADEELDEHGKIIKKRATRMDESTIIVDRQSGVRTDLFGNAMPKSGKGKKSAKAATSKRSTAGKRKRRAS